MFIRQTWTRTRGESQATGMQKGPEEPAPQQQQRRCDWRNTAERMQAAIAEKGAETSGRRLFAQDEPQASQHQNRRDRSPVKHRAQALLAKVEQRDRSPP